MLSQSRNLWVHGRLSAEDTGNSNATGVSLNGLEQQSTRHASEIFGALGIGEGLIGSLLLQAVEVCHVARSGSGCGVAQEAEDNIDDALGVFEVEELASDGEDEVVGVLLGNLTFLEMTHSLISSMTAVVQGGGKCQTQKGVESGNQS